MLPNLGSCCDDSVFSSCPPPSIEYGDPGLTNGHRHAMKTEVTRIADTPARDRGAKAINDFRLHSGYKIVVVNIIIQNCREAQKPFQPMVRAILDETSPKHKLYERQQPKQKTRLAKETNHAEFLSTSFSQSCPNVFACDA
mmetsp:Transcript_201/g.434  ORF Transcript_201/g.434 Transcript_201/m.434 type:complete len:141 (+) Transcript_201:1576-1998(+)